MTGLFANWQPRYAECGIATFPVREKRPAVRGYLKIGMRASRQFALKFPIADAFGLACRRSRITVLDVDAPDERLLADAMSECGPSPFVVRSASGNFQAWYRHSGERRRVRPDPYRPIDILGDGFVVAPPSRVAKGKYEIISGRLDDLAALPLMRHVDSPSAGLVTASSLVEVGRRNDALWRHCMANARLCGNITALMEEAVRFNRSGLYEPLPAEEVLRVVASAWNKEASGTNWFGRGGRVIFDTSEVDGLLHRDPDAFVLLTILRRRHWGREFFVANAMAESMPGGGWRRQRFAGARQRLLEGQVIEEVRPASRTNGPAIFRFKGVQ
jgi:hypothetical protein